MIIAIWLLQEFIQGEAWRSALKLKDDMECWSRHLKWETTYHGQLRYYTARLRQV